jgi:hypothetical protein
MTELGVAIFAFFIVVSVLTVIRLIRKGVELMKVRYLNKVLHGSKRKNGKAHGNDNL